MVAPVVSQTGLNADVDSLPSWETVVQGIGGPGCEFYFRRATGSYVSRKHELEYSSEANSGAKAAWARLHSIWVTVKRPKADGSEEVLPQQLAIWAVCLLPGTERGKLEVNGSVKAILKELGFEIPDKIWASARPPGGGRWATLGRLALGWTAPRSLFAAQTRIDPDCFDPVPSTKCVPPEMEELVATVTATCPGLDLDAVEGSCSLSKFVLDGIEIIPHTPTPVPAPSGSPGGPKDGPKDAGDGGDDGDEGSRVVAFNLNCQSPPRGSTGGCRVSTTDTAVTLASLTYAWETGAGVARPAGTGESLTRWEGTATSTLSMTVGISGPDIASKTLNGTVTVSPRVWSFSQSTASLVYSDSGLASNEWGAFLYDISGIATGTGTGPWKGEPYTTWAGESETALHLHPDLDPAGGPEYATTSDSSRARRNRSCARWTRRTPQASVLTVNGACGTSGTYSAWRTAVGDHEAKHKDYYNQCARSQDVRDKFAEIEALTGAKVSQEFTRLETDLVNTLRNGILGNIGGARPGSFWFYRQTGQWLLDNSTLVGHGRSPCP